jgi:hypothetical protein
VADKQQQNDSSDGRQAHFCQPRLASAAVAAALQMPSVLLPYLAMQRAIRWAVSSHARV